MASSVFYRFKSQKEPSRVTFDGTGISVFELKKEIIALSHLGDGSNFELILSSSDTSEEFEDDTEIVPRSTTVIAKRLPAARPGKGGAARYVSGKPPVNARNSSRAENSGLRNGVQSQSMPTTASNISELQTEEQRMAAVLKMGEEQWKRQQKDMANATPVYRGGVKSRVANVPDHPPPDRYVCKRCGVPGHWLKECPQNGNPLFDDNRSIKKTTGIPRSMLKTIEKTSTVASDGTVHDARPPPGVMVDANGNWVIAEPDKEAWDKYQEKANKSVAAQQEAARGSKELQERGLECPIDKRMFVDPTKTPCCQTTYCNECITTALLDDGLQCPNCGKDGVLIDDLYPDELAVSKIRDYKEEKLVPAQPENVEITGASSKDMSSLISKSEDSISLATKSKGPHTTGDAEAATALESSQGISSFRKSPIASGSKKRKAESDLENQRKSPTADTQGTCQVSNNDLPKKIPPKGPKLPPELAFMNQPPFSTSNVMIGANAFMPMSMSAMMGMNAAIWNPMMSNGFMGNQWNGMNNVYGLNLQGMMMPNSGFGQPNGIANGQFQQIQPPNAMTRVRDQGHSGLGNQQRNSFTSRPSAEDSAYFRQPVNPHRHQSRRNVPRPTDYREI